MSSYLLRRYKYEPDVLKAALFPDMTSSPPRKRRRLDLNGTSTESSSLPPDGAMEAEGTEHPRSLVLNVGAVDYTYHVRPTPGGQRRYAVWKHTSLPGNSATLNDRKEVWDDVGEDNLQFLDHGIEKIGDSTSIAVKGWRWDTS